MGKDGIDSIWMIQTITIFWIDVHQPPEVMPMSPPPSPWSFLIMYRTWGGWGRCSKAKNSGQWPVAKKCKKEILCRCVQTQYQPVEEELCGPAVFEELLALCPVEATTGFMSIIVQAVSRAQLRLWSASRPIRVKTSEAWRMAWPNCSWSARWGPGGSWWHVSVMSKSWSGCGGGLSASSDSMFPLGSTNWLEISMTTSN